MQACRSAEWNFPEAASSNIPMTCSKIFIASSPSLSRIELRHSATLGLGVRCIPCWHGGRLPLPDLHDSRQLCTVINEILCHADAAGMAMM
jgi:hypothetical protein